MNLRCIIINCYQTKPHNSYKKLMVHLASDTCIPCLLSIAFFSSYCINTLRIALLLFQTLLDLQPRGWNQAVYSLPLNFCNICLRDISQQGKGLFPLPMFGGLHSKSALLCCPGVCGGSQKAKCKRWEDPLPSLETEKNWEHTLI